MGDIWEINTVYRVEFGDTEEATIYRINRPVNMQPLSRLLILVLEVAYRLLFLS